MVETIEPKEESNSTNKIHRRKGVVRLKNLAEEEKENLKKHGMKFIPKPLKIRAQQKDTSRLKGFVHNETLKFNIRMSIGESALVTSVSLKKNIISLWIVMMEKQHEDPYEIIQRFIEKVCMPRWKGSTAKGFSTFITKAMIHSILDENDWITFKQVYLSL